MWEIVEDGKAIHSCPVAEGQLGRSNSYSGCTYYLFTVFHIYFIFKKTQKILSEIHTFSDAARRS
jgi:hypothetical protein